MYVYQQSEPGLYTVGYYTPNGQWISESDHNTAEAAAIRVSYLNGGNNQLALKLISIENRLDDVESAMNDLDIQPRRRSALL